MDNDRLMFLSYAAPDRHRVNPWYSFLKERGFNPWIDKEKLLGGQAWDYEIRKALNSASLVVMFISQNSTGRRGYIQREIKLALSKLEEKLLADIYIVPVLLDTDATRPDQLSDIQFLDANEHDFGDSLIAAIQHQFEEAETATSVWSNESDIAWTKSIIREEWSGVPGYSFNGELVHFSSGKHVHIADLTDIIKGWFKSELCKLRSSIFSQGSYCNFGQMQEVRTNTWDAYGADPIVRGRTISLRYIVHWYGAGAAHPNYSFKTFVYLLDPFSPIETLEDLFCDAPAALTLIQESIVKQLTSVRWSHDDDEVEDQPLLEEEWIRSGIDAYEGLSAFTLSSAGIEIHFGAYQVGAYSTGAQHATIPYDLVNHLLVETYRSALDLFYEPAGNNPPTKDDQPIVYPCGEPRTEPARHNAADSPHRP